MPGEHAGPRSRRIPVAAVARLPTYHRVLTELRRRGVTTVSSEQLARRAQVNAAKVRKDLSLLGSFGTRGTGYDASFLIAQIDRALGTDRDWPIVVVGMGNLGRALVNSEGFSSHGFRVAALFDVDPSVIGHEVNGIVVQHIDEVPVLTDPPAVGVVTTPASVAQDVVDLLVHAGTRAVLNFAPRVLSVPSRVLLRSVDLSVELQVMSFYLARDVAEGPKDVLPPSAAGMSPWSGNPEAPASQDAP